MSSCCLFLIRDGILRIFAAGNFWIPLTDISSFFSHRNVMMRLNLQLTMGTFSLSLFGLIGVAFGMNLESSLEEVRYDCCFYQ